MKFREPKAVVRFFFVAVLIFRGHIHSLHRYIDCSDELLEFSNALESQSTIDLSPYFSELGIGLGRTHWTHRCMTWK